MGIGVCHLGCHVTEQLVRSFDAEFLQMYIYYIFVIADIDAVFLQILSVGKKQIQLL